MSNDKTSRGDRLIPASQQTETTVRSRSESRHAPSRTPGPDATPRQPPTRERVEPRPGTLTPPETAHFLGSAAQPGVPLNSEHFLGSGHNRNRSAVHRPSLPSRDLALPSVRPGAWRFLAAPCKRAIKTHRWRASTASPPANCERRFPLPVRRGNQRCSGPPDTQRHVTASRHDRWQPARHSLTRRAS